MPTVSKKLPILLCIGDLAVFFLSLILALIVRTGTIPENIVLVGHLVPFSALFAIWITVFFIAGLYDADTMRDQKRLTNTILNVQIVNSLIAAIFFYFIPLFGITPKTFLLIQLSISLALILPWRLYGREFLGMQSRERAILVGTRDELNTFAEKINKNAHYFLQFVAFIDPEKIPEHRFKEEFLTALHTSQATIVALDLRNEKIAPILPDLYELMFMNVRLISVQKLYEEVFNRIPLSLLDHNWILENISLAPRFAYDILKRAMDITCAAILLFCALPLFPIVALLIKLDDGGPIFIAQERVGKGTRIVRLYKIRSMKQSDGGKWLSKNDDRITRTGKFLRKSRIDELPQLWNVLCGDLSLIGPRPDILELGKQLTEMILYYNIRSTVTPGLSGWAQVNQEKPPQSLEETRRRLEYDLYYIKNRSFMLDVNIALRTLKILLMRTGM